jgi:Na+/proline symporter
MFTRPSREQHEKFQKIFGTSMERYWSIWGGFLITNFDTFLKEEYGYKEDNKTSIKDFLGQKFGQEAVDLIYSLITNEH